MAVSPSQMFVARFNATHDLGINAHGADSSILRVSKAFSHEALRVLYAESIFESWLDFVEDAPYTECAKKVTDPMMKLKFHIIGLDGRSQIQFDPEGLFRAYFENMEDICETTINRFTGTDITRNYMHIIFHSTSKFNNSFTTRPLFESLKKLGGFRTVRVDLRSSLPIFEKDNPQVSSDHMD